MTKYAWLGSVWTQVAGATLAEDKAVSETDERRPLDELIAALRAGTAVQVPAALPTPTPAASVPATSNVIPLRPVAPVAPAPEDEDADDDAGTMDDAGRKRAEDKIQAARAAGMAVPASQKEGLFFDAGTRVMATAWKAERAAFDDLPAAGDALTKVRAQIMAEGREDVRVPAWSVRMSPRTGRLGVPDETGKATRAGHVWTPSRKGLQAYTQRAGIGAVPDHWPQDVQANAINTLCERFGETPPGGMEEPDVVVRVQRGRGDLAYAVVSPSYAAFDGDKIVEALLRSAPRGSRVNVDYDPDQARGKIEIVTLQEETPVVGEPFRTSFTVGWDDTGSGSIWGDGGLFSVRCLNLTRIYSSAGRFRIRHAGNVRRLADEFRRRFDRIAAVVHGFARDYGYAAEDTLTNDERIEGREFLRGIYRSLLQRPDLLPVRGRKTEAVVELAAQAELDENKAGITRAGIANGITRYAHRVNQDPWVRDDLERAAGRILQGGRGRIDLKYVAADAA